MARQIAKTGFELAARSAGDRPTHGFTMTSVEKVGINPSTRYETPVALYAYPVTPTMVANLTGGKDLDIAWDTPEIADEIPKYASVDYELPFVSSAPYVSFFEFNDKSTVYYTSTGMDEGKYRASIDRLFRWFREESGAAGTNPDRNFRAILIQAIRHHKPNANAETNAPLTAGSMSDYDRLATIWTLTRAMSMIAAGADYDEFVRGGGSPTSSSISLWRSLLLMLRVTAVVDDMGKGLIHKNEPEQMAVFDTNNIRLVQMFDNVTKPAREKKGGLDTYWKGNPQLMASKVDERVKSFEQMVSKMQGSSFDEKQLLNDISTTLNIVYNNSWMTDKVKFELRDKRLAHKIVNFAIRSASDLDYHEFINKAVMCSQIYDLSGRERWIIAMMVDKLISRPDVYFVSILSFVRKAVESSDKKLNAFIIDFCEQAFERGKNLATQNPGDAEMMLKNLAYKFRDADTFTMSRFIQLVMPIIKSLPQEVQSSSEDPRTGKNVPLIDALRSIYGENERAKAEEREKTQVQNLTKKLTNRPYTRDLYADLGGMNDLREQLSVIVRYAQVEIDDLRDQIKDRDKFFDKNKGVLKVEVDVLMPNEFIPFYHRSSSPEQRQEINRIYNDYKTKINSALKFFDAVDFVVNLQRSSLSEDEVNEKVKDRLLDHARQQIADLASAVSELKVEMSAYFDSIDDKSVEQSPLYETLLIRLLKMK